MSTHQQLLYHVVFSTQNRQRSLTDGFREQVFGYMAGIAGNQGGFALQIGGYYDHVHLLVQIPAKLAVSSFVRTLKSSSSKHVNDTSKLVKKFGWQDGFGAFTVSPSHRDRVIQYIADQMNHHANQPFEDEYLRLLKKHGIEFDPRYVWD